jgi:hypothetical protein
MSQRRIRKDEGGRMEDEVASLVVFEFGGLEVTEDVRSGFTSSFILPPSSFIQ